jgi:hypothetical protein
MNASLELVLAANQFRALQPIILWLLVRSITGDEWMLSDEGEGGAMRFKTFLNQNKLQERFGIIGEIQVEISEQGGTNPKLEVLQYAVLGIPDVYALPLSSAQRQSIWGNFTRWKERVWKTLPILREHGFIAAGSKAIIPFLNLIGSEVKADRKDDFAQWCDDRPEFELDKDKGRVIEFSNVCDDAADLLEKLATRLGESSAVDAPKNQESGDNQGDGRGPRERLTTNDRCIWKAMLELNATALKPETGPTIVKAALYRGDAKRAFTRLIAWGFVGSKGGRGGGYWLTESGVNAVKTLP